MSDDLFCGICCKSLAKAAARLYGPYCTCAVPQTMTTNTTNGLSVIAAAPYGLSFTLPKNDLRCPKCGHETSTHLGGCVYISVEPYSGRYCIKCYSKWIAENTPMMEEIK